MIKKIQADISADIQASIKDNTSGDITGDLLQEKMLLLNGKAFNGEVAYLNASGEVEKLYYSDLMDALAINHFQLDENWGMFVKEWYNSIEDEGDTALDNTYVAVYDSYDKICCYVLMRMGYTQFGRQAIIFSLLANAETSERNNSIYRDIASFKCMPYSSDMEDNNIVEYRYSNEARVLNMDLPNSPSTQTFPDYGSLLAALGINYRQWDDLVEGRYVSIRNTHYSETPSFNLQDHIYPIQTAQPGYVLIGYTVLALESGITWVLKVNSAEDEYEIHCYDNL